MNCTEIRPLLDAYFDSELDLSGSLNIERHLVDCAGCSAVLKNLDLLRAELTPEVFDLSGEADLGQLRASVRREAFPPPAISRSRWGSPALYGAIAAALVLAIVVPATFRTANGSADREVVDSHVRSLMAEHLVDVPSSDRHTVKPWFQGKLDFAPDVIDLTPQGFTLIGGRMDVIGGQPAAAVVYKRRGHFLNLWTSRSQAGDKAPVFTTVNGYQVVHWKQAGMERWVASDLNQAELQTFIDLLRGR